MSFKMDVDLKTRRQVSFDQLKELLEFMKDHQVLARGLTRGRRGKLHSLKLWNLCAKKLNVCKDGATKDGKGWSKYWCDWKYRVKRRALELKAARESNRPSADGVIPLSQLEEGILSIIGENAIDGVVIRTDPLANDEDEEGPNLNTNNENPSSFSNYTGTTVRSLRNRKRRHSSRDLSEDDCGERSDPRDTKPIVNCREQTNNNSEHDDDAKEFLRLEKEKLDNSNRIRESVQTIASEITRMADIMSTIRDVLINNRISI